MLRGHFKMHSQLLISQILPRELRVLALWQCNPSSLFLHKQTHTCTQTPHKAMQRCYIFILEGSSCLAQELGLVSSVLKLLWLCNLENLRFFVCFVFLFFWKCKPVTKTIFVLRLWEMKKKQLLNHQLLFEVTWIYVSCLCVFRIMTQTSDWISVKP